MLKSLEIVNEFIKNIEDTIKEIKSGPFYDIRVLDLNKFKTIKQSLEVLEILNKYIKVEHYRPIGYKEWKRRITLSVYEEIPVNYFGVTEDLHQFTKEELLKIESWIKSNKVGDNHD